MKEAAYKLKGEGVDVKRDSKDTKGLGDKIIHQFIQGFLNPRKKECKQLKEVNLICQKMIKTMLSQKTDTKCLLFRYEDDPWIQKILINYILLKISHHATFWGTEDLQPKPKKIKGFNMKGITSKE